MQRCKDKTKWSATLIKKKIFRINETKENLQEDNTKHNVLDIEQQC